MEPIPMYLRPVLVADRSTPAHRAVVARAHRLRRNYPEDIAIRFVQMDLNSGRLNRRDANATGWLLLHPSWLTVLEGGAGA